MNGFRAGTAFHFANHHEAHALPALFFTDWSDALIVTVCGKGGGRSERAASMLRDRGFSWVRSLCGGTDAWFMHAAPGAGS